MDWPSKHDVFGIGVSSTSYGDLTESVVGAVKAGRGGCISHLAVHGLITGVTDPDLKKKLNDFEVIAPDGMPVKKALKWLYRVDLPDRVYGPEFMLRLCERAAREDIGVYLYGSQGPVVEALAARLLERFPTLQIVGCEPSVFRPLTDEEDKALVERINRSKAGIVFVGLGCPRQEEFAALHKDKVAAVQVCVGAAFDFHADNKKMAPSWMQDNGLEWLYRLFQEPTRLWKRYFYTNTLFIYYFLQQFLRIKIQS